MCKLFHVKQFDRDGFDCSSLLALEVDRIAPRGTISSTELTLPTDDARLRTDFLDMSDRALCC
jgi:hypothetical protein